MTSVVPGSMDLSFPRVEDLVAYTYENLAAKGKPKAEDRELTGLEVEFFPIETRDSAPINLRKYEVYFNQLQADFNKQGYKAQLIHEIGPDGLTYVVSSLQVDKIGKVVTEAGLQFELATLPRGSSKDLEELLRSGLGIIVAAAKKIGHRIEFRGHMPGWAAATEGSPTSRGFGWTTAYDEMFGNRAPLAREFQHATAATQDTIDVYLADIVEKVRVSKVAGPLLAALYNQPGSRRLYMQHEVYAKLMPAQAVPIYELWDAESPEEVLAKIAGRLMTVPVPMLPNPRNPKIYMRVDLLSTGRLPTVGDITSRGLYGGLTELNALNLYPLLYDEGAYRHPEKALLEMRSADSMGDPARLAEYDARVRRLHNNPAVRAEVLEHFRFMDRDRLARLYLAVARGNYNETIGGHTVAEMVDYIEKISAVDNGQPSFTVSPRPTRRRSRVAATGRDSIGDRVVAAGTELLEPAAAVDSGAAVALMASPHAPLHIRDKVVAKGGPGWDGDGC